jgi:hypothetical protein
MRRGDLVDTNKERKRHAAEQRWDATLRNLPKRDEF